MPNLLSLSKHKEFESNSALQIRNQKERRSRRRAEKVEIFASGCKNFAPLCEIFAQCEISLAIFDFWPPFDYFFLFYPSFISHIEDIIVFLLT